MRPGRHGSMTSSELESLLIRNGNFLTVLRAGSGDGQAGLFNSVTGAYLGGIGGGTLPEYSRMTHPSYNCPCTPGGHCRTGLHGIKLIRGWRNLLYELAKRGHVRINNDTVRVLGADDAQKIVNELMDHVDRAPMNDPAPAWNHSQVITT